MICPKCGDPIEQKEKFCNKCGNLVENLSTMPQQNQNIPTYNNNQNYNTNQSYNNYNNQNYNTNQSYNNYNNQNYNNQYYNNQNNKKEQMKMIFIGAGAGFGILLIVFICMLLVGKNNYYFNEKESGEDEVTANETSGSQTTIKNPYQTVVVTDHVYEGVKINSTTDAIELIQKDSISQKDQCPAGIKEIEEQLIRDYDVIAVNLCELNLDFAREIVNVFDIVYKEYPKARGHLTNLSLINGNMSSSYIAAFQSFFLFASSDSSTEYPYVYKAQIVLNTKYFLNEARLEASVIDGSAAGHFPPNATKYSPVAHELAHYLSYIARMYNNDLDSMLLIDENNVYDMYNLYNDTVERSFSLQMIEEAYNNYKNEVGTTLAFDDWRATISGYAVSKDNNGNYQYDETIAEAFHDVYLNGENAVDASKYVIAVLKSKLEGE